MGKVVQRRKASRAWDVADVKAYLIHPKTPIKNNELVKAKTKLRQLIDQTQYEDAKILFLELVRTTKFGLSNTWKVGAEIVGKTSPEHLASYLKAVYVNSPKGLSPVTFNAYIDQLMIDKDWSTAIDEIELVYPRTIYHHPLLLRKMAICAYHQWYQCREKLPEEFLEEDIYDPNDRLVLSYERYSRVAKKYMSETAKHYLRDTEFLNYYFTFLSLTNDEETKKSTVLSALESFNEKPDPFLLYLLFKINEEDKYFKAKPYVLHLYECSPLLEASHGLIDYVNKTCMAIKNVFKKKSDKEMTKYQTRAVRIFHVFARRLEHGILEFWFLRLIHDFIFKYYLCSEICSIYREKNVDKALRKTVYLVQQTKTDGLFRLADSMKDSVEEHESKNHIDSFSIPSPISENNDLIVD